MKFLFFIFLFVMTLSLSCAATLRGGPSSLEYDLGIGEEECQTFSVFSPDYSKRLYSVMKWAPKNVDATDFNQFILNESEINISVSYSPGEINDFDGQEEIEICISGEEVSYYEGVLEYRTQGEGNIGVGVGVILRVTISDKYKNENPEKIQGSSSGGGGGSSGGSSQVSTETESNPIKQGNNIDTTQNSLGELEETDEEKSSSGLTGAIVGSGNFKRNWIGLLIGLVIIVGIAIIFSYNKRKRRKIYGY